MKFINCQKCNKKLMKVGVFDELSIKCPRCKTLNHLSVQNASSEDHESQTLIATEGTTRGKLQSKTKPQSTRQKQF